MPLAAERVSCERHTERAGSVISVNPFCQIELWNVAEGFPGPGKIRLCPILGEAVGVFEIIGLKIGFAHAIQMLNHLVKRPGIARTAVEGPADFSLHCPYVQFDDVVDIDEIPPLGAVGEDAWA